MSAQAPVTSSIQHFDGRIDDTRTPPRRAVPYHCPFCAGDDLRPTDAGPGAWHCAACLRIFSVSFLGLAGPTRTPIPVED